MAILAWETCFKRLMGTVCLRLCLKLIFFCPHFGVLSLSPAQHTGLHVLWTELLLHDSREGFHKYRRSRCLRCTLQPMAAIRRYSVPVPASSSWALRRKLRCWFISPHCCMKCQMLLGVTFFKASLCYRRDCAPNWRRRLNPSMPLRPRFISFSFRSPSSSWPSFLSFHGRLHRNITGDRSQEWFWPWSLIWNLAFGGRAPSRFPTFTRGIASGYLGYLTVMHWNSVIFGLCNVVSTCLAISFESTGLRCSSKFYLATKNGHQLLRQTTWVR